MALLINTSYVSMTNAQETKKPVKIKLESPALAFSDGKSYGFTGEHIGFIAKVVHKLEGMKFGEKNGQAPRVGIFEHEGTLYSIKELTLIEQQDAAPDLEKTLTAAKRHFNATILPFMEYSQGVRPIIIELIEESCQKRHRMSSFLRTWGQCADGKEQDAFNKGITSFKKLDQFIADLMNFLKDLVDNCPKACAQFKELQKQNRPS